MPPYPHTHPPPPPPPPTTTTTTTTTTTRAPPPPPVRPRPSQGRHHKSENHYDVRNRYVEEQKYPEWNYAKHNENRIVKQQETRPKVHRSRTPKKHSSRNRSRNPPRTKSRNSHIPKSFAETHSDDKFLDPETMNNQLNDLRFSSSSQSREVPKRNPSTIVHKKKNRSKGQTGFSSYSTIPEQEPKNEISDEEYLRSIRKKTALPYPKIIQVREKLRKTTYPKKIKSLVPKSILVHEEGATLPILKTVPEIKKETKRYKKIKPDEYLVKSSFQVTENKFPEDSETSESKRSGSYYRSKTRFKNISDHPRRFKPVTTVKPLAYSTSKSIVTTTSKPTTTPTTTKEMETPRKRTSVRVKKLPKLMMSSSSMGSRVSYPNFESFGNFG